MVRTLWENKIVVHFLDGKVLKGRTRDFSPKRKFFYLSTLSQVDHESPVRIEVSSLKAVFFVKDYKGNKNHKKVTGFEDQPEKTPAPHRIVVYFKDGEVLYGTTHSYSPNREGFFVYPIDPSDNNERVYVVQSAVKDVWFERAFKEH